MGRLSVFAIFAGLLVTLWIMDAQSTAPSPSVENLRTFAKLYGYVRFFHPSDEAAATDWERFAVHGAGQVADVESRADLRATLERLFHPIAPALQLYPEGEAPPPPHPALAPEDSAELDLVAWQHRGVDLGMPNNMYLSARLNRADSLARQAFGVLSQYIGEPKIHGEHIRLRAAARSDLDDPDSKLLLWVRVDRANGQPGFFDNMQDRPIVSEEWDTYEITGPIAEDAWAISLGAILVGSGTGWVDAFEVEFRHPDGTWHPAPVANADFLDGRLGETPAGWILDGIGYRARLISDDFDGDERAAVIESPKPTEILPGQLFAAYPDRGEILDLSIGSGLAVQLPIALYSRDGHTLPAPDAQALGELRAEVESVNVAELSAEDLSLRLAGVTIGWNVLQHFYPYFDVVETDWEQVLTRTLEDTWDDRSVEDFAATLSRMLVGLQDGHARAGHPDLQPTAWPPFRVDIIEDQVLIVATSDSAFRIGDVVVAVDGRPAMEMIEAEMALASGSERWRRVRARRNFATGPQADINVALRRDKEELTVTTARLPAPPPPEPRPENIAEIQPGIFYVNLYAAEIKEIYARMADLAGADGVIFDLRGYPRGNHGVLQHLTDRVLLSARWQVPQILYPDRRNLVGYDTTGRWRLPPLEPRIEGEIVFLTNAEAISYSESVMGIVEHYRLGEIVGEPTAGTNGNVNRIRLPGDYTITFTGMRVLKHDGSQHHLVGILPTIPVERTAEATRAGRDEYIEAALDAMTANRGD